MSELVSQSVSRLVSQLASQSVSRWAQSIHPAGRAGGRSFGWLAAKREEEEEKREIESSERASLVRFVRPICCARSSEPARCAESCVLKVSVLASELAN